MTKNKATLVTSLYNHGPREILGGRGWGFPFYAPPFLNILKLDLPIVIYTHELMSKMVEDFMATYATNKYKIIIEPLTDFKYSDKILSLRRKSKYFKDDLLIKGSDILNDRNTHLCLSKMYWLQRSCSKNYFNSDKFYWIDAGLFHHGIFPEKFGGMERFTKKFMDESYYYPQHKKTIFSPEMGNFLTSNVQKFLALVHTNMPTSADIDAQLDIGKRKIGYIVGGIFGGNKTSINNVANDFDKGLQIVLNNDKLVLEENLLSSISAYNNDYYEVYKFDQWHHDIEGEPCYYGATSKVKSFYKIFKDDFK
jgi:hypothetical protein